MLELSLALIFITCVAGFLVNKYLNIKYTINTAAAEAELSTASNEQFNKFDSRINDTWATVSSIKQELEALKLSIGLKR